MSGRTWRDRAPCGTNAGYLRHQYEKRRYGTPLDCRPCRDAHTADAAERRHLAYAARMGVTPAQWAAMGDDGRQDVLWAARRRRTHNRDGSGKFARQEAA